MNDPQAEAPAIETEAVSYEDLNPKPPIDFVIAVATPVEKTAVLEVTKPLPDRKKILKVYWQESTYYLGQIGRYSCSIHMSEAGAGGHDGASQATGAAIDRWTPRAVLMPGISFGRDSEAEGSKQIIRDVLVSTRVIAYELQRVGKAGITHRGGKPPAGPTLLNRLRNLDWHWDASPKKEKKRPPEFGPLLSGDKLVDDPVFKAQLFTSFSEAIGGEMEGHGVADAADRRKVEWILMKAICDWGDGTKKKEYQAAAAATSCSLLVALLSDPGLDAKHFGRSPPGASNPGPNIVEAFSFESANRRIEDTHRLMNDAVGRYVEFVQKIPEVGGKRKVPKDDQGELKRLEHLQNVGVENWLNAYNELCSKYLAGVVSKDLLFKTRGQEIIELFELKGAQKARLEPRATSAYQELWSVYDQLRESRSPEARRLDEAPASLRKAEQDFSQVRILKIGADRSQDSTLDSDWLACLWAPEPMVACSLFAGDATTFLDQVAKSFADDRTPPSPTNHPDVLLFDRRCRSSDYHRQWALSASGALFFRTRIGRGPETTQPVGYLLLDLLCFLLLTREWGHLRNYPGDGSFELLLNVSPDRLTLETPQPYPDADGMGFDFVRGTLAVQPPSTPKPRYGPYKGMFSLPLRAMADERLTALSSAVFGAALRDHLGFSVDEPQLRVDAQVILSELKKRRRFRQLPG